MRSVPIYKNYAFAVQSCRYKRYLINKHSKVDFVFEIL